MSITEKTLVIGIDIAKEVQYAREFDYRGRELSKVHPRGLFLQLRYSKNKRDIKRKLKYREEGKFK